MNSSEKILKIQKYSRIAAKVLIAVQIIFVLATAVLMCVLIGWSAAPFANGFTFSNINVEPLTPAVLFIAVVLILVKIVIYWVVLDTVRRIMKDIAAHSTPFETIHVSRMKRIAILILIGSFINLFSIQLAEWCVALVVWFLSMVFDYGCQLQQESDETL